jgi:hypothetical protein
VNVKETANRQLRAEFPILFDEKQPISLRRHTKRKATEMLDRDNHTDPEGVAEMKRQLSDLWVTISR